MPPKVILRITRKDRDYSIWQRQVIMNVISLPSTIFTDFDDYISIPGATELDAEG